MTERTVTEKQIIAAMNNNCTYKDIISELFPELPNFGELVLVWDDNQPESPGWYEFREFADGNIGVINYDDDILYFDNYRRQTPAERGES
jgi:hypothetical protein